MITRNTDSIFLSGKVLLFFANIESCMRSLSCVTVDNYDTMPPTLFTFDDFRTKVFSEEELRTINSFKAMKKQYEWICGRYCVKKIMLETFDIPMTNTKIIYDKGGAPLLAEDPDRCISITHSGKYAGAAVAVNYALKCGLDLEKTNRKGMETFMKVAYTDYERKTCTNPDDIYTIWTAKEAYLKYIKRGFAENLKSIEYRNSQILHKEVPVELSIETARIDSNHIYTLMQDLPSSTSELS